MSDTWISFRTDPRPTVRLFGIVFIVIFALLATASVVGQMRTGYSAGYMNNAFTVLVPLTGFSIVAGLAHLSSLLFPVKIGPAGIRAYASFAHFKIIAWDDIATIRVVSIYGIHYFYIADSGAQSKITIPAELARRPEFRLGVEKFAGPSHPLVEALVGANPIFQRPV